MQKAQDYLDFPTVSVHNSAQSSQKFLRFARLLGGIPAGRAAAREAAVNVFLDGAVLYTDGRGGTNVQIGVAIRVKTW